jgi:hypothetical protein
LSGSGWGFAEGVDIGLQLGAVFPMNPGEDALIALAFKFVETIPVLREFRGGEEKARDGSGLLTEIDTRIALGGSPAVRIEIAGRAGSLPGSGDLSQHVLVLSAGGERAVNEESINHGERES